MRCCEFTIIPGILASTIGCLESANAEVLQRKVLQRKVLQQKVLQQKVLQRKVPQTTPTPVFFHLHRSSVKIRCTIAPHRHRALHPAWFSSSIDAPWMSQIFVSTPQRINEYLDTLARFPLHVCSHQTSLVFHCNIPRWITTSATVAGRDSGNGVVCCICHRALSLCTW